MQALMMDFPLTTHAILEYGNRVFPHKEIVTKLPDGSWHRYRYADLYQRVKKLSYALVHQLEVHPGDRVATFAWNHYQHVELYYGIPGAGAVCHTLNIRLSTEQIIFIVNHAEAKIIFIDATLVPLFEKIAPYTTGVKQYVLLNSPENFTTNLPNCILYEHLLQVDASEYQWYPSNENDACGLCYTSGTTGNPKGALYSHRSTYLHALALLMPNAACLSARDRVLLIVPQFHVMAWGFPYVCLLAGSDMILPSLHLQPEALIQILEQENITIANGVPTIWLGVYEAMKKNPPKQKLALREYVVGGSALPPSLIEAFEKDFGIKGVHAWGMTETSPIGTASRLQTMHNQLSETDQLKIRAKQGIELPGVEIRAITEEGKIAPRDGVTAGEFEIRGAWIIKSYYKYHDNHLSFTEDGWFKTGDVGTIDAEGYMNISDRSKDLIKSGGEWISSVALEIALMAHPEVKEACVIAIPDEKWVERPLACIVYRGDAVVSKEAFNAFLGDHFAAYQLPDRYIALKEIPKTSVGKLNKKELRRMYSNGEL